MVTGRKVGLIINGDIDSTKAAIHLNNVEQAAKVLRGEGYEVFAVNPTPPQTPVDHYIHADLPSISSLMTQLKGQLTTHDDLVIYATGHGAEVAEEKTGPNHANAGICIDYDCEEDPLKSQLDALPYHQRTFIIDACQGGNWQSAMLNDPNTLFISAGSVYQDVCCEEFAPRFWSERPNYVIDTINWQDRFSQVFSHPIRNSSPVMMQSPGYIQPGAQPFPESVIEINSLTEYQDQMKRVTPGQYAIMTFSAPWCGPCKAFHPQFDQLAQSSHGQYLFLRSENEEVLKFFEIKTIPTVMAITHKRQTYIIQDRDHILEELAATQPTDRTWKSIDDLKTDKKNIDKAQIEAQLVVIQLIRNYARSQVGILEVAGHHVVTLMSETAVFMLGMAAAHVGTQLLWKLMPRDTLYRTLKQQYEHRIAAFCNPQAEWSPFLSPAIDPPNNTLGYILGAAVALTVQTLESATENVRDPLEIYKPDDPILKLLTDMSEVGAGFFIARRSTRNIFREMRRWYFANPQTKGGTAAERAFKDALASAEQKIRSGEMKCIPAAADLVGILADTTNNPVDEPRTAEFRGWSASAKGYADDDAIGNILIALPVGASMGLYKLGAAAISKLGASVLNGSGTEAVGGLPAFGF